MTIDILICSLNKGIVRVHEVLRNPMPGVNYIISYQYTDDRYLELVPRSVRERSDVRFYQYKGQGLSNNRNHALEHATSDLVLFADDDARLADDAISIIMDTFAQHPKLDVAFFRASTYTGKLLKSYPEKEFQFTGLPEGYSISTIEMVARRTQIQGKIRFDERFGLGTKFLTCREEDVWLTDALRAGLHITYFPLRIIETSTMLKRSMIYVDAGVQRSEGAFTYYLYGNMAYLRCLCFAINCTRRGLAHFLPMLRHLYQGIHYIKRN